MALARDAYMEVVPLINEEPPSFVFSHLLERFDNGQVSGELEQPSNRHRRVFHFEGISTKEVAIPSTSQTKIRRILNYFNSGGQLRVYRMWPAVSSQWSESNELGYSDVVSADLGRADYSYYTPALDYHNWKIDGVEVATVDEVVAIVVGVV